MRSKDEQAREGSQPAVTIVAVIPAVCAIVARMRPARISPTY